MATFCIPSCYELSNGKVQEDQLTPALIIELKVNLGRRKLRNHSRESGPYISQLLNEAYDDICLYAEFPTERTRAYLGLCRIHPDVYSTRVRIKILGNRTASVDCGYSPRRSSTSNSSVRLSCTVSETVSYLMWCYLPRAWIKSQTSWLRRKRCTGDVNLHLHLAP